MTDDEDSVECINMKSVVFITSCLGIGGAERVVSILASHFSNMEVKVTILAVLKPDRDYLIDEKVVYKYVGVNGSKISKTIKTMWNIRRELDRINPDAIFSFLVLPNILSIWATRFTGYKLIISERNDPYVSPANKWFRKIRDFSYTFADGYVFQTPDAKEYFKKKIGDNSVIIPNPIKKDMLEPYCGNRDKRIVAVGRLLPQKNLIMLLDAFTEFHKLFPDWSVEFYGDGVERQELERYSVSTSAINNIHFMGYCTDVHEKIRTAGMYVSTSNYEGISNSMLEALALGIPTIVTDCPIGGARMVINDGVNGFLIPVNDSKMLSQRMREIAENDSLANMFSCNAAKIREKYGECDIAKQWLKLV